MWLQFLVIFFGLIFSMKSWAADPIPFNSVEQNLQLGLSTSGVNNFPINSNEALLLQQFNSIGQMVIAPQGNKPKAHFNGVTDNSIFNMEGDWSTKGNGTGILCYKDNSQLAEVDKFLASNLLIPTKILQKGILRILESWEQEQNYLTPIKTRSNENWKSIYDRAGVNIRNLIPIFMQKVDHSAKWTDFALWLEADQQDAIVETVEQVTPKFPIPKNCRLIPVVTRYSKRLTKSDSHHPQGDLVVKVVFYKEYFNALSSLDQAMLVFHEQIHVLGQELGHPNSDQIRNLISLLFSEEFGLIQKSIPDSMFLTEDLLYIKNLSIFIFGDYIHFFNENRMPKMGEVHTPERHYSAFFKLNSQVQELVAKCQKEMNKEKIECMDIYLSPLWISENTTDDDLKNYMYWVHYYLEQTLAFFNADYVMNTNLSPKDFKTYVLESCQILNFVKDDLKDPTQMAGALRYCETWK